MSSEKRRYDFIDPKEAHIFLNSIESQLKTDFESIRKAKFNPNTKGGDYENILKIYLETYLSGGFDFLTRSGVIDVELKAKKVFKEIENEFDIIALKKNAIPKLVYKHLSNRLVCYDSIGFLVEAKQTLTSTNLRKDLTKFDKLNLLKTVNRRPKDDYQKYLEPFKMKRPLRFLFYYEARINKNKMQELMVTYKNAWDILVALKANFVLINTTVPLNKTVNKNNQIIGENGYPLLKAIFFASISTEEYFSESWDIFANLFASASLDYSFENKQ